MTRALSIRDILAILERIPDAASVVLAGEQALAFWAETLGIAPEDAGTCEPVDSLEIELLGSAMSAVEFGRAAGGNVRLAALEDAVSLNIATVKVTVDGEEYRFGFLGGIQGFSELELEKVGQSAMPVCLAGRPHGQLRVIHPVHCLREMLETVYRHPLCRCKKPRGERRIARINLALEACRRITLRHLEQGELQAALKIVEAVHAISVLPAALRAWVEDSVCMDQAIVESAAFPKDFRVRRLRQLRRARKRKICWYRRTYGRAVPSHLDIAPPAWRDRQAER